MARYNSKRFDNRLQQDEIDRNKAVFDLVKWAKAHGLPTETAEKFWFVFENDKPFKA